MLDSDEREKILDVVACGTESSVEVRENVVAAWAEFDVNNLGFADSVDLGRCDSQQVQNAEVAGSCQ